MSFRCGSAMPCGAIRRGIDQTDLPRIESGDTLVIPEWSALSPSALAAQATNRAAFRRTANAPARLVAEPVATRRDHLRRSRGGRRLFDQSAIAQIVNRPGAARSAVCRCERCTRASAPEHHRAYRLCRNVSLLQPLRSQQSVNVYAPPRRAVNEHARLFIDGSAGYRRAASSTPSSLACQSFRRRSRAGQFTPPILVPPAAISCP